MNDEVVAVLTSEFAEDYCKTPNIHFDTEVSDVIRKKIESISSLSVIDLLLYISNLPFFMSVFSHIDPPELEHLKETISSSTPKIVT